MAKSVLTSIKEKRWSEVVQWVRRNAATLRVVLDGDRLIVSQPSASYEPLFTVPVPAEEQTALAAVVEHFDNLQRAAAGGNSGEAGDDEPA